MTRNGFSFKIESAENHTMYNVLAVPYRISEKFYFIDNRIKSYDYVEEKSFFGYLIAAIVILVLLLVVIILIIRKTKKTYFTL